MGHRLSLRGPEFVEGPKQSRGDNWIASLALAMTSLGLAMTVHAKQGPFPIRSQHPLYLQMVNINPTRPEVLAPGLLEVRVDSAYSNLFEQGNNGTFNVDLDMELWRLNWVATYGFWPEWEVSLEIPTLHFEGGFLDGFIQNFHDAFGFPNGGRELRVNGFFRYQITQSGQVLYNINPQTLNAGDLTLRTQNQITYEEGLLPATAWIFAMKFPSGDPDFGLGSGNVGFGLGVALEKSYRRLHGFLNLNFLYDGGNETLENLMVKQAFDFSLAGEYAFSKKVSALVQLVGGTPRLKGTDLDSFDGVPLDLIVGARGAEKNFFWQAAFSEDVTAKGPSVDFTAWISVGYRFATPGHHPYRGDFLAQR